MAGTPAYKKKVQIGLASTGPWHDFPATTASLDDGNTVLEDTDLTSTGERSRVLGLRDWSISITCNWSGASSALTVARNAKSSRTDIYARYLPNGTSSLGFKGPAVVENFNLSGGVDELETVDINIPSNGALGSA